MQQIFVNTKVGLNQPVALSSEQLHHLQNVVRLKNAEQLRVVDSDGKCFLAVVEKEKDFIVRCIRSIESNTERSIPITLVMGLIKKEKWDFCLQKCTELGVSRIIPFESRRTVVKGKEERSEKKMQRWNKIVQEASQQCKRNRIPEILPVMPLSKAIDTGWSEINLVAWEKENDPGARLRDSVRSAASIMVVIGPEGGFDLEEIAAMKKKGVAGITLGPRILRAETAAVYVLSALDALLE